MPSRSGNLTEAVGGVGDEKGLLGPFFSIDKGPSPAQLCRNGVSGACPAFYSSIKFPSSNFSKRSFNVLPSRCGFGSTIVRVLSTSGLQGLILKLSAFPVSMVYFILRRSFTCCHNPERKAEAQNIRMFLGKRLTPLFHSSGRIFSISDKE